MAFWYFSDHLKIRILYMLLVLNYYLHPVSNSTEWLALEPGAVYSLQRLQVILPTLARTRVTLCTVSSSTAASSARAFGPWPYQRCASRTASHSFFQRGCRQSPPFGWAPAWAGSFRLPKTAKSNRVQFCRGTAGHGEGCRTLHELQASQKERQVLLDK